MQAGLDTTPGLHIMSHDRQSATMPHSQPWVEAMKKPSRAGGKPAKAQRRKALKLKGRNAPRAAPRRSSSRIGQIEVARLARELNEARAQQAAMADVLTHQPVGVRFASGV